MKFASIPVTYVQVGEILSEYTSALVDQINSSLAGVEFSSPVETILVSPMALPEGWPPFVEKVKLTDKGRILHINKNIDYENLKNENRQLAIEEIIDIIVNEIESINDSKISNDDKLKIIDVLKNIKII